MSRPIRPRPVPPRPGENSEESNERKTRSLLLIPRLLWVAAKSAPIASIILLFGAVFGGIVAALELLVVQRLVDALAAALPAVVAGGVNAGAQVEAVGTVGTPFDAGAAGAAASAVAGAGAAVAAEPFAVFGAVLPWVFWLAAAMLAATALELGGHLAEVDVQERVGIRLQRDVIVKAHSVELVHFEHPSFYDSLERANQDMGGRIVTLMRSLVEVLGSATGMIAILAVLWQAHWSLAPIMVVGVVPGFWVMLAMRKKTWWVYRIRTPESRLSIYLANLLTRRDDAKEVRLFTLADHLSQRWLALARKLAIERRHLETKQAWLGALTSFVATAAYSGCLLLVASLIGGEEVRADVVSIGTFAMLMQALQQFGQRIGQVMHSLSGVHEQSLYLSDLYEFLEIDAPEEPGDAALLRESRAVEGASTVPGASALPEAVGIELEDVWFTYPGGEAPVLKGVSLVIHPGERIALIGENGAGKSTLIRLILGLYRPTSGRILVDGRDIREIPKAELYRYFAAVFQEYAKYQYTVKDNIRFGRLWDATDDDVRLAAMQSGADEFIQDLPDGYDTLLGRPLGGLDLSGGQWQKLAIARALVRRAPVVILDEPTAALDPKAEAEVYRQFGEMTRGRTSILISHRLGSARLADRIVVLKGGRIVEIGTHEELLAARGEYAGFFTLQAQWYQ